MGEKSAPPQKRFASKIEGCGLAQYPLSIKSMSRTLFAVAVLLLASSATPRAAEPVKPSPASRPNLVFFLADDLRPDCLGVLGHPIVKTPNLDKLLQNGFIFRNAYVLGSHSAAVCLPSRTMIMTGISYLRGNRAATATPTLAQTLKASGYVSIRSGKSGNTPKQLEEVFDRHLSSYDAGVNADNLVQFIQENAGKRPLFLYMASAEPHDPQLAPADYYRRYQPEQIPLPVNFLPYHPFDNGEMVIRDEQTLPSPRTRENVTGKLARYYASITYWDAQAGRVVEALKKAGQFDNTIFVVAGDNGLSLGEHGLLGKQNLYEFGGMHIPLVFAGPGIPKGDTKAFAYLYEVYPTLCELAGIPVPAGLDAKSLKPVIDGRQSKMRDCLFTAYRNCQRAIRDERWKLIRYPLIDKTQLFDLQNDPHEMNDLGGKPESAGKIKELTALMLTMRVEYGDNQPLTVPNPKKADWTPDRANDGNSKKASAGSE